MLLVCIRNAPIDVEALLQKLANDKGAEKSGEGHKLECIWHNPDNPDGEIMHACAPCRTLTSLRNQMFVLTVEKRKITNARGML